MLKGNFVSPIRCFPTRKKWSTSPVTLVHSALLEGIIEFPLWGPLGMLQNSLCCTISCYFCFQSILGGKVRQFCHKIIIQELLVWIVGWIKIHPYVINTHPWDPFSKLTWHAKDSPSCWCHNRCISSFLSNLLQKLI